MNKKEVQMIKDIILKYRNRKLKAINERKQYETDHGHDWIISLCLDIEIDLKKFRLGEFVLDAKDGSK